jgi:hypothetical protein
VHSTRREFLDDFLQFVGEKDDANARILAGRLLNQAVTEIWLKHPWRVYRSSVPLKLTLTINQARYALPDYVGRVGPGRCRNSTRGGCIINQVPTGQLDQRDPVHDTSSEQAGAPREWDLVGGCGVATQPLPAGEALEVLSDNAADTDVVVAIAGDDSTGAWTRNQVTLNGPNAVPIGTWSFVDDFGKSYQASSTPVTDLTTSRGTVTLRKATDHTTVLQRLFAQESAREHPIFVVYPKPFAADTLLLPIIRKPKRLLQDADPIPDLWDPMVWEEMLVQWMVNTGDLTLAAAMQLPRPKFLEMVSFDNLQDGPPPPIVPFR